jgi:hypothetical protein
MAQYYNSSLFQFENADLNDGWILKVHTNTPATISCNGNVTSSLSGFGNAITQSRGFELARYEFHTLNQLEDILAMGTAVGSGSLGGLFIISWKAYMPTAGYYAKDSAIINPYDQPFFNYITVGNSYVTSNPSPPQEDTIRIPGVCIFKYATRAGFSFSAYLSRGYSGTGILPDSPWVMNHDETILTLVAIFPDGSYTSTNASIYGMKNQWHNFAIIKSSDSVALEVGSTYISVDVSPSFDDNYVDANDVTYSAWFRPEEEPAAITELQKNHFSIYSSEDNACIDEVATYVCGTLIYRPYTVSTIPGDPTIPLSPTDIANISVGDVIKPSTTFPNGATVLEVHPDYILASEPAASTGGSIVIGAPLPNTSVPAQPPYTAASSQRLGQITVGDAKITELNQNPATAGYESFISSLGLVNDAGSGKVFVKSGNTDTDWTELVQHGDVTLSSISQSGATTGQVPSWNGTAWTASTPSSTNLGSVSVDVIPSTDNEKNLGSTLKRWMSIFATKIVDTAGNIVLNITSRLLVDSSGTPVLDFSSTNLNVLNKKITNLSNATDNADAVNFSQLKDPTNITQDSTHRFVSDTQISTWGSGEPAITAGTTSQYYRGDKTWQTLDKTAVGLGNVPNVDATIASNITQDTTHRFVTDTDKSNWNSSILTDTAIANTDVDWTTGTTFYKSVNADTTLTFSNTYAGKSITVVIVNSNSSSYINITFPAGIVSVGGSAINGYILPGSSKSFKFTKSNGVIYSESLSFPQQVALSTFGSNTTVWPLVKSYYGSGNGGTMSIPCVGSKNGDIITVGISNGSAGSLTVSFTASDATSVTFFRNPDWTTGTTGTAGDGIIPASATALFTLYRVNNNIRVRKEYVV